MKKDGLKVADEMVKLVEHIVEKDRINMSEYSALQRARIAELRKMQARLESGKPVNKRKLDIIRKKMINSGIINHELKLTDNYKNRAP